MTSPSTKQLLVQAGQLFRAGHREEALLLTRAAVDQDPADSGVALAHAQLLSAAGQSSESQMVLKRALTLSPESWELLTNLGVLLCSGEGSDEGVRLLRRAAELQPSAAAVHYNLGNALKAKEQLTEAVSSYRKAIECDPRLAPAHRNLGNSLVALGDVDGATAAYETATVLRRTAGATPASDGNLGRLATVSKLRHDAEQIDYLLDHGHVGPEISSVASEYRGALAELTQISGAAAKVTEIPAKFVGPLSPTYNRLWHRHSPEKLPGGALNPALDPRLIEEAYAERRPGMTAIDDFLRPEAITSLQRFCLESTFWFQFNYADGYLGAFWEDGFWCPLLAQISEELRSLLPGIFKSHTLRKCWAFKYDSQLSGIPIHADFAAVNVNFWITPDSANLDPEHGGLVVWDKEAPQDWDFHSYNRDHGKMRDYLAKSDAKAVTFPYRQNRVVIFNSDLFHQTDSIRFSDGYENRRINITLLYGIRSSD